MVEYGYFHKAIPVLEKLVEQKPEDPDLLQYLGFALRADADSLEAPAQVCQRMRYAIEVWKKWLAVKPSNEAYIGVGTWYSWIGEYDSALVYLNKSIALKPRDKAHHAGEEEQRIAQVYFLMKDTKKMQKYLALASIKGYPVSEPMLIPNPCKVAELLAQRDSAHKALMDSLKLDSTYADTVIEMPEITR